MENLNEFLAPALMLFFTGFAGTMFKRNAIIIFMCVELMLTGAMLVLLSFAAANNDIYGATFTLFILAIAAAEVAVGLALLTKIFKVCGSVDTKNFNSLGD